jgi:hypothetical protein
MLSLDKSVLSLTTIFCYVGALVAATRKRIKLIQATYPSLHDSYLHKHATSLFQSFSSNIGFKVHGLRFRVEDLRFRV